MTALTTTIVWAVLGAAVGFGIGHLNRLLTQVENLEGSDRDASLWRPAAATCIIFALFAQHDGLSRLLLIHSLWVSALMQILFFDLQHHLILNRVIYPSFVAALVLAQPTPGLGLVSALIGGLGAGLLFLLVYVVGRVLMGQEAVGLGDVKLALLIGLVCGLGPNLVALWALVLGAFFGGLGALAVLILRRRGLQDAIAYGPYLVLGTLVALLRLSG